jgi:hypothetical protein
MDPSDEFGEVTSTTLTGHRNVAKVIPEVNFGLGNPIGPVKPERNLSQASAERLEMTDARNEMMAEPFECERFRSRRGVENQHPGDVANGVRSLLEGEEARVHA